MVTVLKDGLADNYLERTPLKSLQTITQMSRQLWPGNRGVLNYRTNVQTVVEQQSLPRERVAESSQCMKEACRFSQHPVGVLSPSKVR